LLIYSNTSVAYQFCYIYYCHEPESTVNSFHFRLSIMGIPCNECHIRQSHHLSVIATLNPTLAAFFPGSKASLHVTLPQDG